MAHRINKRDAKDIAEMVSEVLKINMLFLSHIPKNTLVKCLNDPYLLGFLFGVVAKASFNIGIKNVETQLLATKYTLRKIVGYLSGSVLFFDLRNQHKYDDNEFYKGRIHGFESWNKFCSGDDSAIMEWAQLIVNVKNNIL